jgi:hypothetical protein
MKIVAGAFDGQCGATMHPSSSVFGNETTTDSREGSSSMSVNSPTPHRRHSTVSVIVCVEPNAMWTPCCRLSRNWADGDSRTMGFGFIDLDNGVRFNERTTIGYRLRVRRVTLRVSMISSR